MNATRELQARVNWKANRRMDRMDGNFLGPCRRTDRRLQAALAEVAAVKPGQRIVWCSLPIVLDEKQEWHGEHEEFWLARAFPGGRFEQKIKIVIDLLLYPEASR